MSLLIVPFRLHMASHIIIGTGPVSEPVVILGGKMMIYEICSNEMADISQMQSAKLTTSLKPQASENLWWVSEIWTQL